MPGASAPTTSLVDPSVAVKWVVNGPHSDAAAALLDRPIRWLAPCLMLVEASAAVRRKTAGVELRPDGAATSLAPLFDAVRHGVVSLADDEDLVANARLLALDLGLPYCIFLILAEREGCSLSTGDRRLARLAKSQNVGVLGVGAAAR